MLDGFTTIFQASTAIGPGVHTMKFAIADTSDGFFDSAVFLQGGSFADAPAPTGYSVGGTVSGLSGSVTLQNNGAGDLTLSADGPFTFSAPLADGTDLRSPCSPSPLTRPAR